MTQMMSLVTMSNLILRKKFSRLKKIPVIPLMSMIQLTSLVTMSNLIHGSFWRSISCMVRQSSHRSLRRDVDNGPGSILGQHLLDHNLKREMFLLILNTRVLVVINFCYASSIPEEALTVNAWGKITHEVLNRPARGFLILCRLVWDY